MTHKHKPGKSPGTDSSPIDLHPFWRPDQCHQEASKPLKAARNWEDVPEKGVPVPYLPQHMLLTTARTEQSGPLVRTSMLALSFSYIKQAQRKQENSFLNYSNN